MADSGVALQGNGHRQVDGTYSETYTKLSSNMPYKINDGIPYLITRLQMLFLFFVKLTIKFKTKNTQQVRIISPFGTKSSRVCCCRSKVRISKKRAVLESRENRDERSVAPADCWNWANGDSRGTKERVLPWSVGLVVPEKETFVLSWLLWSTQCKKNFLTEQCFLSIVPIRDTR